MAALDDLIAQIEDETLRERILAEVKRANKQKKFGLVFEQHLPEATLLYDIPVKRGSIVSVKGKSITEMYRVESIADDEAVCIQKSTKERITLPVKDLVCVAQFGESIYPYLKPIDSICNAPDSDLWHVLIEADNYHALQLLIYLYSGKVDCIYIDPPYNTGAKDWKYNNNYVESADSYRHSKWLSFMEKRLKLAKQLLKENNSLLIVTIDDKEYLHLGCLLEEIFPEARIQMISDVINPKGTMQRQIFPRTDEYIFYVWIGDAEPLEQQLNNDWLIGNADNTKHNRYRWQPFVRANISRAKTPSMFYPIFVNKDGDTILRVGESLPPNQDKSTIEKAENEIAIFPINTNGEEAIWHLSQDSLWDAYKKGYVRLGAFNERGMSISYLSSGMQKKLDEGVLPILGRNKDGSVIFGIDEYDPEFIPGTQWRIKTHDATEHGTKLLQNIIGKRFSYPKSLYATEDSLRFFVSNKPNALILDFFAGSGTTLHAVNLLNAEDNGQRRCIIVTNNEVSAEEAKSLTERGYKPGDDAWDQNGIARYVTWPRVVSSIRGIDVDGKPINGSYFGSDKPMSDGFAANAVFFKLGFLDKTTVALGRQFKELIPILWMKAGAHGSCPKLETDELPEMLIWPENQFAILNDDASFEEFAQEVKTNKKIKTIFVVTDSETGYREMVSGLKGKNTYQLYRDYLDNFRLNHGRRY